MSWVNSVTTSEAGSASPFDSSGFVVNQGQQGLLIPSWVWIAAAVIAAAWVLRKKVRK